MKAAFIILLFALSSKGLQAQNLVPNPSFEEYNQCPTANFNITDVKDWKSFTESPDYYNACGPMDFNVPYTGLGYQQAYEGGAFIGELTYADTGGDTSVYVREYTGVQLLQPLVIGQKYYVSFQAALSGLDCWSGQMGAKFTTYDLSAPETDKSLITNSAQVFSTDLLKDTLNWTQIKGSFIADSAYRYIVLGNFFNDANTDTLNCAGKESYAFIDMVCVSTDSTTCYGSVVPVKFLKFSARKKDNSVILDWITANEENTDYYKVEKSKDGIHFNLTDTKQHVGTGIPVKNYHSIDATPFDGNNYYRITEVNKDGKITSSPIKVIRFTNHIAPTAYITPSNLININLPTFDKACQIFLFNSLGQEVYFTNNSTQLNTSINIQYFISGVYVLKIFFNNQFYQFKLLKV